MNEQQRETRDGIEAMILAETTPGATSVCVRPLEPAGWSHAVVRLFYRIAVQTGTESGAPVEITLSMLDVVPLVGEAFSMTTFKVPLADVAWVRIEPMRSYGQIDFFRPGPEAGLLIDAPNSTVGLTPGPPTVKLDL